MTIKEIAELCGVEGRTVLNWIHKIIDNPGKNFQGLAENLRFCIPLRRSV